MDFMVSPRNFFQGGGCPSQLQFQVTDSEGVASHMVNSYKSSDPADRLSIPGSSEVPLISRPFSSILTSQTPLARSGDPSARKSRRPRRGSDCVSRPEYQKWHNEDVIEDRLKNLNLALSRKHKRSSSRQLAVDDIKKEYDPASSFPFPSDLAVPLTVSDWDSAVVYQTAPAHGRSGSGTSSGVSRQSHRLTRSGRIQQGYGQGDFPSGGRGGPGGRDDGSPSLPQPIDPPPSDGKKYFACWFWLYDPVKYHACADIRKEAHHLKHIHLPLHFPNGLPPELRHRMNYDAVWHILFPGHGLPDIKDRDERLLLMAQQYQMSTAPQPPVSVISVGRRDNLRLSPDDPRYKSDNGARSRPTSIGSGAGLGSHPSSGRQSSHRRPGSHVGSSFGSSTGGNQTYDAASSNASSWLDVGAGYDYMTHQVNQPPEECNLRPDTDGISNPVDMDLESDRLAYLSQSDHMEIDNLTRSLNSPFYPINPRLKIVDLTIGEDYFFHERHPNGDFDFTRFYLVHLGDRSTGADGLISMRSLDVLRREYYYNLTPRADGEGFVLLQKLHYPTRWPS